MDADDEVSTFTVPIRMLLLWLAQLRLLCNRVLFILQLLIGRPVLLDRLVSTRGVDIARVNIARYNVPPDLRLITV